MVTLSTTQGSRFHRLIQQAHSFSPVLLRVSMALVFLYFGITQLQRPESFIYWLPDEASLIPLAPTTLILLNASFEVIFGTLLLLGILTRLSSFLLAVHLLAITLSIGLTEVGVRDFGLTMATFVVFFNGADKYCLQRRFTQRKADKQPNMPSESTKKIVTSNTR